jgi:predicted enzyme related to lactoylglutathione lyase
MNITNIRTFIPAKDFTLSKSFYLDIGFNILWEGEDLVIFGKKEQNFFLQDFYVEDWANNTMLQLHTTELDSLYATCEEVAKNYNCKIKPIFESDYGRTFHLLDPAGVLWHITESETVDNHDKSVICDD